MLKMIVMTFICNVYGQINRLWYFQTKLLYIGKQAVGLQHL